MKSDISLYFRTNTTLAKLLGKRRLIKNQNRLLSSTCKIQSIRQQSTTIDKAKLRFSLDTNLFLSNNNPHKMIKRTLIFTIVNSLSRNNEP